ncbi:MAG: hypothetical protein V4629_03050 [Pseudomonadota bacterium]
MLNRKKEMEDTQKNFIKAIDLLKNELTEKIQDVGDLKTREIEDLRQKQLRDAVKVATYSEECRIKAKSIDDLSINVNSLTAQFTGISSFHNLVAENSNKELLRLDIRVNGIESILKEGNKETMNAIYKVSESVQEMAKTVARIDERTKIRGDE